MRRYAERELEKYNLEERNSEQEETGEDKNYLDGRLNNLRANLRRLAGFILCYRQKDSTNPTINLTQILKKQDRHLIKGAIEKFTSNYSNPDKVKKLQTSLRM